MSVLFHRCVRCGHPDLYGSRAAADTAKPGCSVGSCGGGCAHKPCEYSPSPELMLTVKNGTDERTTKLVKPGKRWDRTIDTCDCPACVAEYERLGGIA